MCPQSNVSVTLARNLCRIQSTLSAESEHTVCYYDIQPARLLTINAPSIFVCMSASVFVLECMRMYVYDDERYCACVNSFMVLLLLVESTADWELVIYTSVHAHTHTTPVYFPFYSLLIRMTSCAIKKTTTTSSPSTIKLSTKRDQLMLYSIFACCLQLFVEPNGASVYTNKTSSQIYRVFAYKTRQYRWLCWYVVVFLLVSTWWRSAKSSFLHDFSLCIILSWLLLLQLLFDHPRCQVFRSHFDHTSDERRTKQSIFFVNSGANHGPFSVFLNLIERNAKWA